MIDMVYGALIVVGAYLLGSLPSGLVIARARGIDIRQAGSGNIGATNVSRTLGKRLGAIVLVLDALKAIVPLGLVMVLGLHETVDPFLLTLTGAAAIAGHCFSIWLRFQGGKGVATSLGAFVILAPFGALIAVGVFAVLYGAFRVASLGSMLAAVALPIALLLLGSGDAVVTLALAAAVLILFTHRQNLRRLVGGKELKV